MAEVGSAFVALVPSARGFGAATSAAVGPQMTTAGKSAGLGFGKSAALGIAAGLAASAAVIGKGLYEVGQVFEDVRKTIIVGTGASGKALDALEASAKRIGQTTPSSFRDVGTAVADLNTRLGLTGKPLETMSSKFLNLSRITGSDLSENIANVTRVFGDWDVTAKDQPKALDAIFEATKRTGIGLDRLTTNVVQFGAPLRQFGFGFEESLALFGKWEKEGVNTEVVLAGLKQGLGRFSKAGKEPQKALEDVSTAIKNAGSAGEANQIAIEAFGQRAGPDMAAAVREGRFELGDMVEGLKNSGGAIDDADKRTRTFSESWQLFKNNTLIPLAPVAKKVFQAFTDFAAKSLPKVTSAFEKVAGVVESNKTTFKVIAITLGALFVPALIAATVGLIANTVAWTANTIAMGIATVWIRAYQTAAKIGAAAQWLLNAAMSANPIGLIVIALIALVAGFIYAWKHSETFREIVIGVWETIKSFVSTAVSTVVGFIKKHWGLLVAILGGPIGAAVVLIIKNWDKIKAATSAAWNFIKTKIIGNVVAFVAKVGGGIADVIGFFKSLPGKIKAGIGKLGSLLLQKGKDLVRGFVRGITSLPGAIKNALLSLIPGPLKKFAGALGLKSPSKLFQQYGEWTVEGYVKGIDRKRPKVTPAVASIADAAIGAAGTGIGNRFSAGNLATATSGAGSAITQNVYPQPRQSEPEIGRHAANRLLWALDLA